MTCLAQENYNTITTVNDITNIGRQTHCVLLKDYTGYSNPTLGFYIMVTCLGYMWMMHDTLNNKR